jgi:hypothetical protein
VVQQTHYEWTCLLGRKQPTALTPPPQDGSMAAEMEAINSSSAVKVAVVVRAFMSVLTCFAHAWLPSCTFSPCKRMHKRTCPLNTRLHAVVHHLQHGVVCPESLQ